MCAKNFASSLHPVLRHLPAHSRGLCPWWGRLGVRPEHAAVVRCWYVFPCCMCVDGCRVHLCPVGAVVVFTGAVFQNG